MICPKCGRRVRCANRRKVRYKGRKNKKAYMHKAGLCPWHKQIYFGPVNPRESIN